ncbi:2-C-methyl-D-erythritol 2,4-cyclodiphosphate synthase [Candidatus Symbiobacter mobilis]|uniref:2-C-methyl-D-erythritol 2,4-cyclodiphosphate synthase n=1 Tax=Candidatus Symbiobacter mobilis CR TaxID=946483 RepID=U5NA33_9BURK|nr:2-C-methyl-D-erythritol 2,4-cyclodiphosphate synthase [Candidatus Symbiobacter mobilis]AGX88180.1 2C-methyl-D-erythritol 2,4-cyclodiphosphate synthase [Candidatus Symbiobacter mobilis CR]
MNPASFRIGQGWDVHPLAPDRKLILGGVDIPHPMGLDGHSDADVLLHAITDALLGAAALRDIGTHFPDTDSRYHNADSAVLLSRAWQWVRSFGYELLNLDSTVIAQAPRMAPYIPSMRSSVALILGVEEEQINIKAKTAEKLGPVGQGQSIEAMAVVLLAQTAQPRKRSMGMDSDE